MPLGRGLKALIPTKTGLVPQQTLEKITQETLEQTGEKILAIPIDQIEPNPNQPRKIFSRLEMEELINSIKEHGIIQPLILTKVGENRYQIVAGERRWRAAKFLELKTVPAIIRDINDLEKLEISLIENLQRQDLNPIERARAYQRLIDEFNLTQEEVAKRVGKARASIANTLRLLTLPEIVQEAIEEGKITEGHAKALLSLEDPQKQEFFLKRILGLGLTVRETENLIRTKKIKKELNLDQSLIEKEKLLSEFFNTKVKIIKKKTGGKILIEFYNIEDLDSIIKRLSKIKD
jgi:ParB family chromosome partitioning protein